MKFAKQKAEATVMDITPAMAKGQVEFSDGKFYWNHDYDAGLAKRLSQAAALLKRHGYRVKAPEVA